MSPLCHVCHDVTEQVRGLATTGQLQYFDINPRSAQPGLSPGHGRVRLSQPRRCPPSRGSSPVCARVRVGSPGPAAETPGPGRESERDLMRVRGPDIKFISRVGWTNESPAFPEAWCQPGHAGQCGGSIRNCLINLIGFVSAPSSLGPSIK